jgi:hypothetical protein
MTWPMKIIVASTSRWIYMKILKNNPGLAEINKPIEQKKYNDEIQMPETTYIQIR